MRYISEALSFFDIQQVFKCLDCKAAVQRLQGGERLRADGLNAFGLCAACERKAWRDDYEAKR